MPQPQPNPSDKHQPEQWPWRKMGAGDKAEARGEINIEIDGYHYWFPSGSGGLSAWDLRSIADKLDKINEPWDAEVKQIFSNGNPPCQ